MKASAFRAQTRIELLLTLRRGESLLVTLAIPLGILVFFSKVDAVNTTFADPIDFLVPGVLALAVMSSAMVSLGIATGYERRYGVLKRLGVDAAVACAVCSPRRRPTCSCSRSLQTVLIVGVGIALGWELVGRAVRGASG